MNIRIVFLGLFSLLLLSNSVPKHLQKKVTKEIKSTFAIEQFQFSPLLFSKENYPELASNFENNNLFKIESSDHNLGYAYIGKAQSKTDQYDYMVLFDDNLIIKNTKVLVYRESHGGEIGSKRWLKQFLGKSQHDTFIYNENIVAISGATISVKSMTNAINNLLKSLDILHKKQLL